MLIVLSLLACDGDETNNTKAGDTAVDAVEAIEPPAYSGGACPELVDGVNSAFPSGEHEREFELVLPDNPEGAPVVFAWHWLGGNARQILNFGGFRDFASEHGAIVVAPETRGLPFEWDTFEGAGSADLIFFDDMLSCVAQQYGADLNRVYTTGMSAGGLWTVTLTHHRAEWLAASAPLSGGATEYTWEAAAQVPMMLTWGGPSDTYGSGSQKFSFHDYSLLLSDMLDEAGHFQLHCVHDDGHNLPPGGTDYLWTFFEAHPQDVGASPWADALPDSLPEWCFLPE